ncbi:ABC transporter ATP-binding protein [Marinicrinis lubricantis]|uniref:ABC transporter ATP-binding protein n=1 Tax=Marinicrinis lubricantis TaxID=2086470 RepID=A0ABW1IQ86_9BACL
MQQGEFKASIGKLLAYSKSYVPLIITAVVLAIAGSIFTIIGPSKLQEITDYITEGLTGSIDMEAVSRVGILLAFLYGLSLLFSFIQGFIMTTVTQKVSRSLRTNLSRKINKLPLRYFDSTSYGDVLSRITNDVDTIGQTMNQSVGMLVSSGTMLLGSLVMMFYTNVWMTLTALAATLVGFFLMSAIMKKSQAYFFRQQTNLGAMNGHIEEIYAGHDVVKVYNAQEMAKSKFNEINENLYESSWKSQFYSGLMMPLMMFIGNFGYVAVCIVGGALALNGHITFGVIVAFMIYVRLFTQPLSQIAQVMTSMQSTAAASKRVFEFLEEEELADENHKTERLKDVKGEVEFRNVNFGYVPDKPIIRDFSARALPGQKIAIVGPTGAGKTTIVNLLMRFYEVNGGEIRIDGIPIHQLPRENVHELFCMVLQDTWLFEGTIKENIVFNKLGVTDDDVEKVCKAVGIDHFIRTLPHGYDTVLNEQVNLSAGQKQLITIARALIEDAPLLILDEATSSVDTRTELLIQEAMDRLMAGRTSFVIAHRLSTIKNADMILVMKDGDIIESGNHEELLAAGGFYADLYNSQFEEAETA